MRRTEQFRPNLSADAFLERLNRVIRDGEARVGRDTELGERPLILVVGSPRSGTTVLMQWLGAIGVAYPSNLAARLYRNPLTAGLLQRLLSDPALDFRGELAVARGGAFDSVFGKTRGCLSPHEFSYFLRDHFPFVDAGGWLDDAQLAASDIDGFLHGLALFAEGVDRPLAIKALMIQYNLLAFLDRANVYVLHTLRNEHDAIRSLYAHRPVVTGGVEQWLSVRPYGHERLAEFAPLDQVAAQVVLTNGCIERQLHRFPPHRQLLVDHARFCADPSHYARSLAERLQAGGFDTSILENGPERFDESSYEHDETRHEIERAVARVASLCDELLEEFAATLDSMAPGLPPSTMASR